MKISSSSDSEWPSDIPPCFPLGQKRREHVQEALVKEPGWNDEVAGIDEQRGCSLSEGMSGIPPIVRLIYTELDAVIPHTEDEYTVK